MAAASGRQLRLPSSTLVTQRALLVFAWRVVRLCCQNHVIRAGGIFVTFSLLAFVSRAVPEAAAREDSESSMMHLQCPE